jgi:hypothetical protein
MKEIDDIDEKDEENSNIQDNYGEDDDGCVNNNTAEVHHHVINKLVNSSAAVQSEAQGPRYKFPASNNNNFG